MASKIRISLINFYGFLYQTRHTIYHNYHRWSEIIKWMDRLRTTDSIQGERKESMFSRPLLSSYRSNTIVRGYNISKHWLAFHFTSKSSFDSVAPSPSIYIHRSLSIDTLIQTKMVPRVTICHFLGGELCAQGLCARRLLVGRSDVVPSDFCFG